jgi:serine/threonine protein kinase
MQVVADCHRRELIHGDLKPENIIIHPDKNSATLVDFGHATREQITG